MKKLILPLLFISFSVHAVQEIASRDEANQIVSSVKDLEIENMLAESKEFDSCRKMNEFDKSNPQAPSKIKDAQKCFSQKLGGEKDPKKLQKLSEALNLQQYGLVKSQSAKEIQEYLNNKMYKALTGVDPEEADKKKLMESLKFKNKKHIDQALFIKLYKTQLSKNALFEISRFCFQDLRRKSPASSNPNFGDHWSNFNIVLDADNVPHFPLSDVDDSGIPEFTVKVDDPEKKDEIYKNMLGSINVGSGFKIDDLKKFFMACGHTMVKMCDLYKNKIDLKNVTSQTQTGLNSPLTPGATACLAKNRIQELKTALANADKVEEQFGEIQENDKTFLVGLKGEPVKLFMPGKDGAESVDNLTNFSSTDLLEGGYKSESGERFKECETNPELSKCASLLSKAEDFEKAKHDVEMEMTLKREVEIARVKALKQVGKQKLSDYLKEQGYYSLLERHESGKLNDAQLEEEIGKEFEAKKVATLQEMNKKLGSRQVKKDASDAEKKIGATKTLEEAKSERARLAQVVMFNNIITSHLDLERKKKDGTTEKVGRNVNAWKKEEEALKKAKVDDRLFSNLKTTDDGKTQGAGIGENEQLGGLQLIDTLLGKKKD